MKTIFSILIFAVSCSAIWAQQKPETASTPTPKTSGELVDGLNGAQLEQAVEILKTQYLNPSALDDEALRRARLTGLLQRLGPGAELVVESEDNPSEATSPFLAEVLDGKIGYIRLTHLDADALTQFDTVLAGFQEKGIQSVVLDLRSVKYDANYDQAAEFARKFCEKGKLLFRLKKPSAKQERIFTSNQDPVFSGTLVLLTDHRTAGAAEVLAAVLRQHARAMIVGDQTAGEAVEFAKISLGGGIGLRVAVAEVTLPEGNTIYPDGVAPDIQVTLPESVQTEIFKRSAEKGVSQYVYEKERPRMNEAALIANINPEIESTNGTGKDRPALKDVVLQRAVDLLTALNFFDPPKAK